jgi:hypothetical protein
MTSATVANRFMLNLLIAYWHTFLLDCESSTMASSSSGQAPALGSSERTASG